MNGVAIRMQGIARYFGPPVEFNGAMRPRESWRTLLRIAGIEAEQLTDDNTQRTTFVAGHVLRDITFDIAWGSVVCLAGPSGSGKSLLLKILAGVIAPTAGRAEIYGPLTTLLDVGENLEMTQTADEQIRGSEPYLGAASPADAERFLDSVLDFTELRGFEHAALRTFSTGMRMRLSIALALCGRPAIVLIDDVLNVGDIGFQQKCVDKVHELKDGGATIVMAVSDETLIQGLATRIVTLGGGYVASDVVPTQWLPKRAAGSIADAEWEISQDLPEDDVMALRDVAVTGGSAGGRNHIDVSMLFEAKTGQIRCRPSVFLTNGKRNLFRSLAPAFVDVSGPRQLRWVVRIPVFMLAAGAYNLMVNMQSQQGSMLYAMKASWAVTLTVRRGESPDEESDQPLLNVDFPVEVEAVREAAAS